MTAAQFREWRARMSFSQAEAAARLGCSKRSVQNWESGTNDVPTYIALAISAVNMNLPAYGAKR